MSDDWDKPTAPLAPGLVRGPAIEPKIALEPVELSAIDPEELKTIEELRIQNKRLQADNDELMKQIEAAWDVIRTRDTRSSALAGAP